MDRTVNVAVYLGVICAGLHDPRAIILGISLILFGGTFAWVDEKAPETLRPREFRMAVGKPKRTADQLSALIKERASQLGTWPPKMTMFLYRAKDSWEVMVSPGKTVQEEEFRTILWIAMQMQNEFDLQCCKNRRPFADAILISRVALPTRILNVLATAGLRTVGDVREAPARDVARLARPRACFHCAASHDAGAADCCQPSLVLSF